MISGLSLYPYQIDLFKEARHIRGSEKLGRQKLTKIDNWNSSPE